MSGNRKKIGVIFASGSLLSIKGNKSIFFVNTEGDIQQWLSEMPELSLVADIEPCFIKGEEGSFSLSTIEKIVETLLKHRADCDGFVVLTRAENMIFASVAVEFMLQGFGKPIIFAGSRYSPEAIAEQDMKKIIKMGGLGLRSNVINAAQIATFDDFPAVAMMYGNKLIKPTKAVRGDFYSINLFRSIDDDYLGKIDFGVTVYRNKVKPMPEDFQKTLSRDVIIREHNVVDMSIKDIVDKTNSKTLLVRVRENQKLDATEVAELKKVFHDVILFNEHYVLNYPSVLGLSNMTWQTAQIKVAWARAATEDRALYEQLLDKECIGEYIRV